MIAFLLIGTFWFWSILTFLFVLEIVYTIKDSGRGIWLVGLLFTVLFILSGAISFAWIALNPLTLLLYIAIYIGIGLLWSMKEWYSFVKSMVHGYNLSGYYQKKTTDEMNDILKEELRLDLHWKSITTWIVYFPFFMLAWVLTEPIKKIAKLFSAVYNKITNLLVNKAIQNISTEKKNDGNKKDS